MNLPEREPVTYYTPKKAKRGKAKTTPATIDAPERPVVKDAD